MKTFLKKFAVLSLIFLFAFQISSVFAAKQSDRTVKDLTRAYEAWKSKGIKFVVRDSKGHFVTWNIGRLESWSGKSKWVVRDTKGHFITHAYGKVENWKNGKTKLVLRDKKGRMLTHLDIKITSKASFAANVVGLRKLKNSKFLAFVQDTVAEVIINELNDGSLVKARVLTTYLKNHSNDKGISNFKPVLRKIITKINFMANEKPENVKIQELAQRTRDLLKTI